MLTVAQRAADAVAFCSRRSNLRRTMLIAAVVGVLLTVINQSGVILGGDATTATWVRCGLNFLVPFLVSNAGLLSGRERSPAPRTLDERREDREADDDARRDQEPR